VTDDYSDWIEKVADRRPWDQKLGVGKNFERGGWGGGLFELCGCKLFIL
jgi:hypothetical protein